MAIAYSTKNGITYAVLNRSFREGGKVRKTPSVNLGRVLDRERGVYRSRERGVFTYDARTGEFGEAPPEFADPFAVPAGRRGREKGIVDFGDVYAIDAFLAASGLRRTMERLARVGGDSALALVLYRTVSEKDYSLAESWFDGSYAKFLHPEADLAWERLGGLFAPLGAKEIVLPFFRDLYAEPAAREDGDGAPSLEERLDVIDAVFFPPPVGIFQPPNADDNGRLLLGCAGDAVRKAMERALAGSGFDAEGALMEMRRQKAKFWDAVLVPSAPDPAQRAVCAALGVDPAEERPIPVRSRRRN